MEHPVVTRGIGGLYRLRPAVGGRLDHGVAQLLPLADRGQDAFSWDLAVRLDVTPCQVT